MLSGLAPCSAGHRCVERWLPRHSRLFGISSQTMPFASSIRVLLTSIAVAVISLLLFHAHIALSTEKRLLQQHGFDRSLIIYGARSGNGAGPAAQPDVHAAPVETTGLIPRYVSREAVAQIDALPSVEHLFKVASDYARLDLDGRTADVRILRIDEDFARAFALGDVRHLEQDLVLANAPPGWRGGAGELRVAQRLLAENASLPEPVIAMLRDSPPIPVQVSSQRYVALPGGVAGELLAYASRTGVEMPQFMRPAANYVVRLRTSTTLSSDLSQIRAILQQGRVPGDMTPEVQLLRDYFPRSLLSGGLHWLDRAPALTFLVAVWLLAATEALVRFRVCTLELALRRLAGRSRRHAILETYGPILKRTGASLLLGLILLAGMGWYFADLSFAALLGGAALAGFGMASMTCYLLGLLQSGQPLQSAVAGNHD